jgi:class 3 adenylate cyclase
VDYSRSPVASRGDGDSEDAIRAERHDVRVVMDTVGSAKAALFAANDAGPVAMMFATSARLSEADDYPGWDASFRNRVLGAVEQWGTSASERFTAPSLAHDDRLVHWLATHRRTPGQPCHRARHAADARGPRRSSCLAGHPGAHPRHPPTDDRFAPVIVDESEEFLTGVRHEPTGDGTLATFDGPARAIRCACAIRDAVRTVGLDLRSGLHTGEVELRGADVAGLAVVIGSRVSALAGPGEVIVSRTVVDLLAGSGIEFEDRGEHELKGVPGTRQLFAVVRS